MAPKKKKAIKRYNVIYADPAWSYRRGSGARGSSESHYQTMTLKQIQKLPVRTFAADDCALFMWATMPMLPEALETMASWGFTFKTCAFVWVKLNRSFLKKRRKDNEKALFSAAMKLAHDGHTKGFTSTLPKHSLDLVRDSLFCGLGHYTRANVELCLVGVRGKPKRVTKNVRQVVITPLRKHSKKPNAVRQRIVKLYGNVHRIELFARDRVDGWDAWGNEVNSSIRMDENERS